jgi:cyclopropane fatty-acyl-phospholipid synthase-like methyltransferase
MSDTGDLQMKPIDPEGFEKKFRNNIDPWDYTTSPFERYKRGVLLRACGCRTYGRGLELACAIGETTRRLARRCLRLMAVDSSATAVAEARRRLRGFQNVTIRQAVLPGETPRGPFDLIVASEIAYYLDSRELSDLLARLKSALAPAGRIVFLNHVRQFDDASQLPALAQRRLYLDLSATMRVEFHERHGRFEVVTFQKSRV